MRAAEVWARAYWHDVLLAGGPTMIPGWTEAPVAGVAEHAVRISGNLVVALRALADDLEVPLSALQLGAHARVLAALSGADEVVLGYVARPSKPALPCRITTASGSWRELLREAYAVEAVLLANHDYPVDMLRRELGVAGPLFEAVLDPIGAGGALATDTVLQTEIGALHSDDPVLRMRYRTDRLDSAHAARIAGYHLRALTLMAADAGARPAAQSLVSEEELCLQIHGLAGPRRRLPDLRLHELIERQVRARPDEVAAVYGGQRWTYRELNTHANRIGRALLARGLHSEDLVAVVTERNLDWLATVLAVLKAGGAYLPIEPHFPAERIVAILAQAGCSMVVTERGSTESLDQALASLGRVGQMTTPGVLRVETAYRESHAGHDLGIPVAADQLAYVYFTSGSTGGPKGAMCEHAGMLNHVFAKIDDLQLCAGHTVAQTAPQCFDISLWQLLSALVVGGRTLLVEQDVVLDVRQFVDTIVGGRVTVLQVVPSYLEVMLSYLEQNPRTLTDLRCVSVTGEAVTAELTRRWFAAAPAIPLVNAYGLTETSDDTNHAVMHEPPRTERVPVGRPVNNVHVYVVHENLTPVPLGSSGEIVLSGVCVGRGYLNDSDLTARAFGEDPHRPGHRIYRSGDYGRWLPNGGLDFLGRRDSQVKVRGFRIEIGEVERALARLPGVRQAAVVVAAPGEKARQLVGFCSARHHDADVLRHQLSELLPPYLVPTVVHSMARLPLTANGKIDRKELARLAETLGTAADVGEAPSTPAERLLAAVWSDVLGLPADQVSRWDHFFDRGGTSLSAVKLVVALSRALSVHDVTRNPVLADLARLLEDSPLPADVARPPDPAATQAKGR